MQCYFAYVNFWNLDMLRSYLLKNFDWTTTALFHSQPQSKLAPGVYSTFFNKLVSKLVSK